MHEINKTVTLKDLDGKMYNELLEMFMSWKKPGECVERASVQSPHETWTILEPLDETMD